MKADIQSLEREEARIFKDCIDIADGTLIAFGHSPGFPTHDQNADFFNFKKRRYGMQATVVCDHKWRIRRFHMILPGSVNDANEKKTG